jgi:fumarate reductase flavoprotein subunit
MQRDFDVIVIGGGGAGLAAANAAGEEGSRVLLVEASNRLGGSTGLSHGIFYAAGTIVQAQAGISDTADAMYIYAMAINQYRMEPSLLRRYCDEGADVLHWLMSKGVEFLPEHVYCSGAYSEMSGVPRCHAPTGYGAAITAALEASLGGYSVDVALKSRVARLDVRGGAMYGIEVDGATVSANAVVISTGGFGANRELIDRYYPTAARHGNETWYIGSTHCLGDGLALGIEVGADLTGFDRGLLLPAANLEKILELPPGWIMLVNRDGRRFINEATGYGVMSGVVNAQPGGECYGIFDSEVFESPPRDPRFKQAIADGIMTTQWTADTLRKSLAEGRLVTGDTLEHLAKRLDVRPGALRTSMEIYNADAAAGIDSLFFKEGDMMRPFGRAPYYAATFRSTILCLTSTGLRINRNAQVLNGVNRPIPGLFAAGETTGGVMGECYIGSGSSVANGIIYGRVAGRNAAEMARIASK